MSKRNKIIISVVILFLLGVIGICKFSFSSGYKIYITNNTNNTVEKLELKYKVGNIIQTISQIESKKSWKDTIDTNAIQGGNSIILTYKDNKGNSYEEYCYSGFYRFYRNSDFRYCRRLRWRVKCSCSFSRKKHKTY